METNEILRDQIFEIIENQIRDNEPKETNLTFKRLVKLGYSIFESKQLIGQCIAVELFDIFKHEKTFNKIRYINNLTKLPKEPFE